LAARPGGEPNLRLLEIDGSFGEGGGQTVRIATSFSMIFNQPIHVTRVRAGRKIPGLRPQHAATLRILRDVCDGSLEGGETGSTEFTFIPGKLANRSLSLDMGTAASITLVLQALVPAISVSRASLELELIGGTDVPWSPTSDYVSLVLMQGLRQVGIDFSLKVTRRGYYPNGGGKAEVKIEPCSRVRPIQLESREADVPISIVSRSGMLPRRVAEQQVASAVHQLSRNGLAPKDTLVSSEDSLSPGSSILVSSIGTAYFMGADSIGARGKPAVKVGAEAAGHFARIYTRGATVDPHMADMLAPLLFLAKGPSSLLTSDVTEHLRTSLHIARQFIPADFTIEGRNKAWLVSIVPG
jgi:RNA 3'-terminal phosphate cyclase (ATP)